jgi:hypothetical protein
MKTIPPLDSFSPRLVQLRAKKAELHVEIAKRKAECALIRERMQRNASDPGNAQEQRVRQLIGETV